MIRINPAHKGSLRKKAHAKKGRNIPVSVLEREKHSKSKKTRAQATFALNARKWSHR